MAETERAVVKIALLYPELLGTYGDGGNALVLAHRARLRDEPVEVVTVALGDAVPAADVYLVGGGEDGPQRLAADALREDGSLAARVDDGAWLLAVCAGFQILGTRFAVAGGADHDGLGLLDVETRRGARRRVGDLAVAVGPRTLVGFENHGGETVLGHRLAALGSVVTGFGNDGSLDGARRGTIVATYAHGPVLAINPWLADEILEGALGRTLEPVATSADRLYESRLAAVSQSRSRRP
jgi:CobQ-like glutamine amidotransferase family enzyme